MDVLEEQMLMVEIDQLTKSQLKELAITVINENENLKKIQEALILQADAVKGSYNELGATCDKVIADHRKLIVELGMADAKIDTVNKYLDQYLEKSGYTSSDFWEYVSEEILKENEKPRDRKS
jgi:hypothetical protein